jgi:hypothetical protein
MDDQKKKNEYNYYFYSSWVSTKKMIGQWMALQLMCIIILLVTSLSEKMNGQWITWQLMRIIIILAMSLSEKMN